MSLVVTMTIFHLHRGALLVGTTGSKELVNSASPVRIRHSFPSSSLATWLTPYISPPCCIPQSVLPVFILSSLENKMAAFCSANNFLGLFLRLSVMYLGRLVSKKNLSIWLSLVFGKKLIQASHSPTLPLSPLLPLMLTSYSCSCQRGDQSGKWWAFEMRGQSKYAIEIFCVSLSKYNVHREPRMLRCVSITFSLRVWVLGFGYMYKSDILCSCDVWSYL